MSYPSATERKQGLTQDEFDMLLAWLDPDRAMAGKAYEQIRRRLIKLFASRGCHLAEDLADETINRVARRVKAITENYTGEPANYFYGVAKKVHLEYTRQKFTPPPAVNPPGHSEEADQALDCLDLCMQHLPPRNRDLVLRYYEEEKQAKIINRQMLADLFSISSSALRLRAHRIRATLLQCMLECLKQQASR